VVSPVGFKACKASLSDKGIFPEKKSVQLIKKSFTASRMKRNIKNIAF
jgi:hypothetical protein